MALPKVRTGRLSPDADKEALDYYDTPVSHWTQTDWDQMDMDYLDVGLHTDPTPNRAQALDRRDAVVDGWFPGKRGGAGDDAMKDMRIHVGNTIRTGDPGSWDKPEDAVIALRDAAFEQGNMGLYEDLGLLEAGNASTIMSQGSARDKALAQMASIRETLNAHDIDTIEYQNFEEGTEAAVDAALNNPELLAQEAADLDKAMALRSQSDAAYSAGDDFLGEQLDMEATDLEDGLEMAREEIREEALSNNTSYISLDPRNVRSQDAAFKKENIGKADMMGNATLPTLAGSAALGAIGSMAMQGDGLGLAAGALDTANRFGETIVNDFLKGSQGLSNALYDTRATAPQVDFAPATEAGSAIVDGLTEDFGNLLNFRGYLSDDVGGLPNMMDVIEGGMGLYDEHVKPLLSERAEQGLGGGALLASMIGLPRGTVTKTSNHLKRVGDAESTDALDVVLEGGDLVDAQRIDPQTLIGRPYVSNMADNSAGDRSVITEVNGTPVGVIREGGYDFTRQPKNVEDGRLWTSEKGAVTGIMNAAEEARKLPGARQDVSPILMPWGMSPNGSSDFAQFSADLGAQYARGNMDPATIRALDERIRTGTGSGVLAGVPSWVGLQAATPEYLTELGGKRKNMLAALDEFRNDGSLSLSQIRQAVADREATLGYNPAGILRVGEIDLGRGVMDESMHQTYSKGVPGSYLGNLNSGASILDHTGAQLRSGINLRDKYGPVTGDKLPAAMGKAMQSNVIGVLDEPTIEMWTKLGIFD